MCHNNLLFFRIFEAVTHWINSDNRLRQMATAIIKTIAFPRKRLPVRTPYNIKITRMGTKIYTKTKLAPNPIYSPSL